MGSELRVDECSNKERTDVRVIYISCWVEKSGEGKRRKDTTVRRKGSEH